MITLNDTLFAFSAHKFELVANNILGISNFTSINVPVAVELNEWKYNILFRYSINLNRQSLAAYQ